MTEELNNQITDSEITVESTETETKPVEPYRTFATEEELSKFAQSERSKAKGEILKSLGINSVSDFQSLKKTYEDAIGKAQSQEDTINSLNQKLVLKGLNVKDENTEDFIELAKKRTTNEVSFEDAAKQVAELYPTMIIGKAFSSDTKIGTEKQDGKTNDSRYSEDMLKRYPWLKNNKKI